MNYVLTLMKLLVRRWRWNFQSVPFYRQLENKIRSAISSQLTSKHNLKQCWAISVEWSRLVCMHLSYVMTSHFYDSCRSGVGSASLLTTLLGTGVFPMLRRLLKCGGYTASNEIRRWMAVDWRRGSGDRTEMRTLCDWRWRRRKSGTTALSHVHRGSRNVRPFAMWGWSVATPVSSTQLFLRISALILYVYTVTYPSYPVLLRSPRVF